MGLHVKVGLIGLLDMLKFKKMDDVRENVIKAAPDREIDGTFAINQNAKLLHPDSQKMIIDQIIQHESAGAKTFVFKREDGAPAAWFRAGQYISVSIPMGESVVTRPYSISSSPAWTREGKVAITVKANNANAAADWVLEHWKEGDAVTISGGEGEFFYERLRDETNVVALAGGSGITPFLSMAYAIRDGIEDFHLTILFGSRSEEAILFRKELEEICAVCDKVKVVHILSDEEKEGYEHGFLSAEIIEKYAQKPYTVMICGPEAMYRFAKKEVEKLDLGGGRVRQELQGVTHKVWEQPDYPQDHKDQNYQLTIHQCGQVHTVSMSANEPMLVAIERAGIVAPSRCRSGECGWCRSKLLKGEVYIPQETDGRRFVDDPYGYIHPCATFPLSDAQLEVPGSYQK